MAHCISLLAQDGSLTNEQMQALVSHLGKIVFIAAVLIAGMLVILTLIIARRVAHTAQRRIEAELSERRPTEFSDTWAAAAARMTVEPREVPDDDEQDAEDESWGDDDDDDGDDEDGDEEKSW